MYQVTWKQIDAPCIFRVHDDEVEENDTMILATLEDAKEWIREAYDLDEHTSQYGIKDFTYLQIDADNWEVRGADGSLMCEIRRDFIYTAKSKTRDV